MSIQDELGDWLEGLIHCETAAREWDGSAPHITLVDMDDEEGNSYVASWWEHFTNIEEVQSYAESLLIESGNDDSVRWAVLHVFYFYALDTAAKPAKEYLKYLVGL